MARHPIGHVMQPHPRLDTHLVLPPQLAQVSTARAFIRQHCQRLGVGEDTCETAVLLTSEVVTNAFIHGRSEARITVAPDGAGIYVEVGDDNSRHPATAAPDPDALDGRGLTILELLAAEWGIRDDPYGKTVWFVVAPFPQT